MPTGYTADVQSGKITEFNDFAMICARAFGALIMMRDEPFGVEIPQSFEPSTFYSDAQAKKEADLNRLRAMTPEEVMTEAAAAFETASRRYADRTQERREQRERYETMLLQVEAWSPPTPDHVEMKTFMKRQLQDSIDFDCNGKYDTAPNPEDFEPSTWLSSQIKQAADNVRHYRDEHEKEVQRTKGRNTWLSELRRSLNSGYSA